MRDTIDVDHGHAIYLSPEKVARMKSMYLGGASANAVGAEFGMAQPTVLRRLRTIGVKVRGRGRVARSDV